MESKNIFIHIQSACLIYPYRENGKDASSCKIVWTTLYHIFALTIVFWESSICTLQYYSFPTSMPFHIAGQWNCWNYQWYSFAKPTLRPLKALWCSLSPWFLALSAVWAFTWLLHEQNQSTDLRDSEPGGGERKKSYLSSHPNEFPCSIHWTTPRKRRWKKKTTSIGRDHLFSFC